MSMTTFSSLISGSTVCSPRRERLGPDRARPDGREVDVNGGLEFFAVQMTLMAVVLVLHTYMGLHIIRRTIIFCDLVLAQQAALGALIGIALGVKYATGGSYLVSLVTVLARVGSSRRGQTKEPADSAGSSDRNHVRARAGGLAAPGRQDFRWRRVRDQDAGRFDALGQLETGGNYRRGVSRADRVSLPIP